MSSPIAFAWLPREMQAELAEISERLGQPVVGIADLGGSPYLRRVVEKRIAEVCMVVRRPNAKVLVFRKPFYPASIFRLLTGGVEQGESIIDALLREVYEETGLTVTVSRFLAASSYLTDGVACFASFAFLLDETGGTLGTLDPHEQVESFRDLDASELPDIADQLERLPSAYNTELDGDVREWGLLRALNHRLVWQALRSSNSYSPC